MPCNRLLLLAIQQLQQSARCSNRSQRFSDLWRNGCLRENAWSSLVSWSIRLSLCSITQSAVMIQRPLTASSLKSSVCSSRISAALPRDNKSPFTNLLQIRSFNPKAFRPRKGLPSLGRPFHVYRTHARFCSVAVPVDNLGRCVTCQRSYPQIFDLPLARACISVLVSKA